MSELVERLLNCAIAAIAAFIGTIILFNRSIRIGRAVIDTAVAVVVMIGVVVIVIILVIALMLYN